VLRRLARRQRWSLEFVSDTLTLFSETDWMHKHYDQAVADGERAVAINPTRGAVMFSQMF
jgi:hypothetical protein